MRSAIGFRAISFFLLLGVATLGCSDDDSGEEQKNAVITQYVAIVRQSYDDAIADAKSLRSAINALIEKPSADTLATARQAWIDARPAYLQSEAYRFYEGPIDDPESGLERRIDGWPLNEAFVDYVRTPTSGGIERKGIINDREAFPVITEDLLVSQNASGAGDSISTGYHAIEFLLWGQDLSASGPGDRPFSDFIGGSTSPDPDSDRRRQYLTVVTDVLIDDLQTTRDAWNDGKPYVKKFLANLKNQSLKNMITGIARLTKDELAVERIRPAYDSQDQEDELSCFSDNTLNDLSYNLLGVRNVYFGRYAALDGIGLENLVRSVDSSLDLRIKSELDAAEAALKAIPAPFDQAIRGDSLARRKVREAIDALEALNGSLLRLSTTLKL